MLTWKGNGSTRRPWRTIGHAISKAKGSKKHAVSIHVAAGTYNENLELSGRQSLLGGYTKDFSSRDVEARKARDHATNIDGGGIAYKSTDGPEIVVTPAGNTCGHGRLVTMASCFRT